MCNKSMVLQAEVTAKIAHFEISVRLCEPESGRVMALLH
jgi:hypothetical protein